MRKEVKQLSDADAAYIAGLIDGEGTITLSRLHRSQNRQLVVSISSTERQLLEFVLTAVGAGKITGKRTYKSHHSPSFTFAIANRQAICLLEQVAAYLKSYKSRRSEIILRDYIMLTPRNGRYSRQLKEARNHFEEMVLQIKPHHNFKNR